MWTYICIALILIAAFLFFVVCINFEKIKNKLSSKKPKAKKQKEEKSQVWEEEPKEKEEPKFVPKNQEPLIPDSTYDFEELAPKEPESQVTDPIEESPNIDEDLDFIKSLKIKRPTNTKKPISKTIKDLPPEIKAMLIDNTLKRRDDV